MYVFYGYSAEVPRRSCDENDIIIYFIKIELILFLEYEDFEDVFFKKECETVSENTRVTYIINLEEGTESLFKLIYLFSERELRILRDYFAEKEIIDWIRRLKSLTGVFILFILKLDNLLRLYIDYRAL